MGNNDSPDTLGTVLGTKVSSLAIVRPEQEYGRGIALGEGVWGDDDGGIFDTGSCCWETACPSCISMLFGSIASSGRIVPLLCLRNESE